MWIEFIYPIIVGLCLGVAVIITSLVWVWHRHSFREAVLRLDSLQDMAFCWLLDVLLGCKSEVVIKDSRVLNGERE